MEPRGIFQDLASYAEASADCSGDGELARRLDPFLLLSRSALCASLAAALSFLRAKASGDSAGP